MPVSCFTAGCDARVFQEIHQFIFIPETLYNLLNTENMFACFLSSFLLNSMSQWKLEHFSFLEKKCLNN